MFSAFNQAINSPLPQEIALHLFCSSCLPARWALVHPIHAINTFATSCCLELCLDFFFGSFLLELLDALLGAFPFIQGFLFFLPHPLLIAHENGVP